MHKKIYSVLVVDDNHSNRELLKLILIKNGYNVTLLDDGEKVIKQVAKINPDIILLDIIMPEVNGFEVCRQLKQMPKIKRIPIIFITGLQDTENIARGFEYGGVDYITQPFKNAELLARLKTHLELKNSRERLIKIVSIEKKTKKRLISMIKRLKKARKQIKTLSGFIPICAHCKNIRDDKGYWSRIETYISSRTEAQFSHGLCPDCMKELYPEIYKKRQKEIERIQKEDPSSC